MPVPAPRTLLIAILGVAPVVLMPTRDLALLVALSWLLGTTILMVIDARFAIGENDLEWTREHEAALSLGAWNPVRIRLWNRSGRSVRFYFRDAVPRLMVVKGAEHSGLIGAGESREWRLLVYPIHRGDFGLGPLTVRCLGPFGLAWREHRVLVHDPVRVYPNVIALREYENALRSGRLLEAGYHRLRRRGEGTEYERLRAYTPDDEFRRINWKATARRATPMVVEYQTERSQSVVFALDAGRLMSTHLALPPGSDSAGAPLGAPALTRLDHCLNACLLLAYVAQGYGDRVGALAFADRVTRFLPPRAGRSQFVALTEALYNLEPQSTEPNFAAAATLLRNRLTRRSLIVFFTDIIDPDASAGLLAVVGLLSSRHLCLVVALQDPDIHRLATQAPVGSQSVYERVVARRLLDERRAVLAGLEARGAMALDVSADRISAATINHYLEVKGTGRL